MVINCIPTGWQTIGNSVDTSGIAPDKDFFFRFSSKVDKASKVIILSCSFTPKGEILLFTYLVTRKGNKVFIVGELRVMPEFKTKIRKKEKGKSKQERIKALVISFDFIYGQCCQNGKAGHNLDQVVRIRTTGKRAPNKEKINQRRKKSWIKDIFFLKKKRMTDKKPTPRNLNIKPLLLPCHDER